MKILTVAILVTLFFSAKTYGQSKVYFTPCTTDEKVFTKCAIPPTFGNNTQDLQVYLSQKLSSKINERNGQIIIRFNIDKTGKTCSEWIENESNFNLKNENPGLIINAMPNWNPGIQNGHKVDCVLIIKLTFIDKKLVVENIDHNAYMSTQKPYKGNGSINPRH